MSKVKEMLTEVESRLGSILNGVVVNEKGYLEYREKAPRYSKWSFSYRERLEKEILKHYINRDEAEEKVDKATVDYRKPKYTAWYCPDCNSKTVIYNASQADVDRHYDEFHKNPNQQRGGRGMKQTELEKHNKDLIQILLAIRPMTTDEVMEYVNKVNKLYGFLIEARERVARTEGYEEGFKDGKVVITGQTGGTTYTSDGRAR